MSNYIRKSIPNFIVAGILVILTVVAEIICQGFAREISCQNVAQKWSSDNDYTQLSVFFSENNKLPRSQIEYLERNLSTKLEESGVTPEGKERVAVSCYSSESSGEISSERTRNVSTRIFGVGGDFFLFHPYELLSGTYFNSNEDENEDAIILDETVAWLLFGSYDIEGKIVDISGTAYVVRGVVRPENSTFSSTVGEDKATIYMNFKAYEKMLGGGGASGDSYNTGLSSDVQVDNYELLVKNPVDSFGKNTLTNVLGMEEDTYVIVENTIRYKIGTRLSRLKDYFKLTMNTQVVTFPYWENRARGYDQIAALITFMQVLFLIYPVVVVVSLLIKLYLSRSVLKDKIREQKNKIESDYQHKKALKWLEKQEKNKQKEEQEKSQNTSEDKDEKR